MSEVRRCVACNYERGFHVSLKTTEQGNKIGLICPRCGQSFDIGWITDFPVQKPLLGRKYI